MLQLIELNFAFKQRHQKDIGAEISSVSDLKILHDISLSLEQGTVAAIMGESGCGKSTLLNVIYGLLQAQRGQVLWNHRELLGADHHLVPGHPMIKYVPQEFDLMPFTTVFENVGEHLSIQMEDRKQRIHDLLEIVEMESFSNRKVKTLSGGQKQRVAIAKALAQEPLLLLLDEPFSHVDNFRKNTLRRKLFKYLTDHSISVLMATHDKEDVLSFTDKTIIMRNGRIIDHRNTADVYQKPKNVYSASLFNDINEIPAGLLDNEKALLLYPHQLEISKNGMDATVMQSYFKGDHYLVQCKCGSHDLWVRSDSDHTIKSSVFISKR